MNWKTNLFLNADTVPYDFPYVSASNDGRKHDKVLWLMSDQTANSIPFTPDKNETDMSSCAIVNSFDALYVGKGQLFEASPV